MIKRKRAEITNAKGLKLQDAGKLDEAAALFLEAAALDNHWASPVYNAALIYKRQQKWEESLKYNELAAAMDPTNQAAWWNLGIAATALGRWEKARSAWRGYGIKVADGDGPPDIPCGFCPIRLNPKGNAEVVWADRVDPARAVIASIPFPESEHRWRDTVLTDGAPTGHRKYGGKDVPVFDALAMLGKSPFGTYLARVKMPSNPEPGEQLAQCATAAEGCAEDWSTSVRFICKACSEGRPHQTHDNLKLPADGLHMVGIAARSLDHAANILSDWQAKVADAAVDGLEEGLPAQEA